MLELADIPERLILTEVSAAEQETDSEESDSTATASAEDAKADDEMESGEVELVQAVGNYTDGVYTGTGYGGEILLCGLGDSFAAMPVPLALWATGFTRCPI